MRKWMREYIFLVPAVIAIAWILPQSLFSDCIRTGQQTENRVCTEEEYVKLFDISKDEIEITWGIKEWIKGFRTD